MRHNAKRSARGGKQQKKSNRMKVYDSNGPDVRIRGTAWQVTEKYETLAKDAETSGNYVLAENYRQHAEHYQRIISAFENEKAVSADGNNDEDVSESKEKPDSVSKKDETEEMAAA